MENQPVVFIGAERVGKAVVRRLLQEGKNIVSVFTAHADLKERIADYVEFQDLEKEYPTVRFHYIHNTKDPEVYQSIKKYHPQLILVASWSQIIPKAILDLPPRGVVGLHYSLLPKRRGGAPLNWAIIDGLNESGISLFYMDEGIDTGDIIGQEKFEIGPRDTVNNLLKKIEQIAPALFLRYFDAILTNQAVRVPQGHEQATHTARRTPSESEIDWDLDFERIDAFVRALSPPYPSAFCKVGNKRIIITYSKPEGKRLKIEGYVEQN